MCINKNKGLFTSVVWVKENLSACMLARAWAIAHIYKQGLLEWIFTKFKTHVTLNKLMSIVCIGVSTPPQKHNSLCLVKYPLKSANCPSPSLFGQSPPILVFHDPPLKLNFFCEPQKYQSSSSFTPSDLLKEPNFLVKIFQFEFLVMTEQSILV